MGRGGSLRRKRGTHPRGYPSCRVIAMPEEDLPEVPQHATSVLLTMPQRLCAIGAGVILGAVGGLSELWARLDGVGTVSFVVAGTASLLLGVAGRMPSRLSGKDYSMEFFEQEKQRAVQAAVEEVVEELPTTAKQEIVDNETRSKEDTQHLVEELRRSVAAARARRIAEDASEEQTTPRNVASDAAVKSIQFEEWAKTRMDDIMTRLGYHERTRPRDDDSGQYLYEKEDATAHVFTRRYTGKLLPILRELDRAGRVLDRYPNGKAILITDSDIPERAIIGKAQLGEKLRSGQILITSPRWSASRLDEEIVNLVDGRIGKD